MASANMHRCVASLMTVLVPFTIMASDWEGTITTSTGVVSLNGQTIRGSHLIMAGDLIKTIKGQAMVRLTSGSVAISENTDARFDASSVKLNNGVAQISGNKALTAKYRDLTIHSVGGENATFLVGEIQGKPTIATLKGVISVTDGTGSAILPAGRAMEAVMEEVVPIPGVAVQENRPAEPAVKGGHGPKDDQERGGKRNRKVLAGWVETAIIIGAVAGILGGLAIAGVLHEASNQHLLQQPARSK